MKYALAFMFFVMVGCADKPESDPVFSKYFDIERTEVVTYVVTYQDRIPASSRKDNNMFYPMECRRYFDSLKEAIKFMDKEKTATMDIEKSYYDKAVPIEVNPNIHSRINLKEPK